LEINQGYTTMHGQPIITVFVLISWITFDQEWKFGSSSLCCFVRLFAGQ